ncbi:regulatory protein RecX [Shewanella sp. SNU WT4]|nr:regulatory protein RecX [Shewanella sp. SNU WT4]
MLARRDHSCKEVADKLAGKDFSAEVIASVIGQFLDSGYLDDERFASALVRSHINKGHGPIRIQQAMFQKGIAKSLIAQSIDDADCDWYELAKAKAARKYGEAEVLDPKEKAKRTRYLLSQGFSYDQVSYALSVNDSDFD